MPPQQQQTDPYAPYAQQADPYAGQGGSTAPAATQQIDSPGQMLKASAKLGGDVLAGIGGETLKTLSNIGKWSDPLQRAAGIFNPPTPEQEQHLFGEDRPQERVGRDIGSVAQFLAPGEAEEGIVSRAPEFLRPAARIATGALSSGAVNKAQGGDFSTGAAAGTVAGALGEGGRAIAPSVVRTVIPGINRNTAKAVLNETRGVRPRTVLEGVEGGIRDAGRDLDTAVSNANSRSTPKIAGFLMPPAEKLDLAPIPGREPASRPMAFQAEGHPSARRVYNQMHYLSGGEHPELSGRIERPQGTMTRTPEMSASIPPKTEPNSIISMRSARQPVREAYGTAASQEAGTSHGRIGNLMDFLHTGRVSGEPIPETITPQRALDLRRGLNDEFLTNRDWQKVANDKETAAAKGAYGGLTGELHEKVPGAVEADERMHNLIPAKHGLKTLVRSEPSLVKNLSGRMAARTGALTSAAVGGAEGAKIGGLRGALAGGSLGLVAPELLSSPTAKMVVARGLYSPAVARTGRAIMTPAVQGVVNYIRGKGQGGTAQ